MISRVAFCLVIISLLVGCGKTDDTTTVSTDSTPTIIDVKSMSTEKRETELKKAQAEHDVASKVFSDLNGLRYEIQVEIGKAKDAGFSGASALIELRKLLKELDSEIAKVQSLTIQSMKVIRQLQKFETGPMEKPTN